MSTTQSKTVREWFNELPEPIRGMAFQNIDRIYEDKEYDTIEDSIIMGIIDWDKTNQGRKFWHLVSDGEYSEACALLGVELKLNKQESLNELLTTAKDTVANDEYGAIGWFMLTTEQEAHLVGKVAIEYHRLLTSK